MNIIFYLGIAMLGGMLLTRITKMLNLPNVTAYLIAGVLLGPFFLNLLGHKTIESLNVITSVALGFIAFSIGDEFKISNLKAIGKAALIITLFESMCAVLFVDVIMLLFHVEAPMAIMLGAMAASTAPAATLLVVRQYKASGPLTNMLLPVVAADDASGLIAYSISLSIAQGMINHVQFSVASLAQPLIEIFGSIAVGVLFGFLLAFSHRLFKSHTNRMTACLIAILMGCAVAEKFNLSSLLVCMGIGAMYVNLRDDAEKVLVYIDDWTYPLFMLFFVISGAELDVTALPKVGLLGTLYIVVRFAGKYIGSYWGASISKCEDVVKKNVGWALMPQAGVAIGMAALTLRQLPQYGAQIQTIILSATLVYELAGPLAAKSALKRAGEIHV